MRTNDVGNRWLPVILGGFALAGLIGCSADDPTSPVDQTGTYDPPDLELVYAIVDTDQSTCYDNQATIPDPGAGEAFQGQDAQFHGAQPSYAVSQDGLTVLDRNTGLTWVRSPDTDGDGVLESPQDKLTWSEAQAYPAVLNAAGFGGYDDWRLPTIKELYSLILFSGEDVAPEAPSGGTPFIDTEAFRFVYGNTDAGERIIDSQYASGTLYAGESAEGPLLFGVNFADGRIKGYGLTMQGMGDKTFFVQCVRGNPAYGVNAFVDNGDGTVTDEATGLMWAQDDSGAAAPGGMNWERALAWVAGQNAAGYLGHDDWRLPDVKELQSIVDYSRSPSSSGSAAIDPIFQATAITSEAGETDHAFYWSSTTHANAMGGRSGAYVAFGRSLGFMNGSWVDVHGAGSQRSDPKTGDPADYPTGFGPQGDAIRIFNFVRLVRSADAGA
ncbi:DUF1566 domain-containing protein [bacterium]|nr:DUF1566 domain-containing protein [bacterium]